MNRNRMRTTTATLATTALALSILPSPADRILYLDAAAPGSLPNLFWTDLTANQHDFIITGDPAPVHVDNPGSVNDYYDMELDNGFIGLGDESLFDFETDHAGAGLGTPFSVNVYLQVTQFHVEMGKVLVSKTDEPATGQFQGWIFSLNGDKQNRADFFAQPGNNRDRLYHRIDDETGFPGGFTGEDIMVTLTHDGSGTHGGTKQYVNGTEVTIHPWRQDGLNGSITNDNPIKIGTNHAFNDGAGIGEDANLYFVEIYDTELTAGEIAMRWNGGDPDRATVSPDRPSVLIPDFESVDTTGVQFTSVTGNTYLLQYTIDTNVPNWLNTGVSVPGGGGPMTLYDPGGFDSNRTYRILRQQ